MFHAKSTAGLLLFLTAAATSCFAASEAGKTVAPTTQIQAPETLPSRTSGPGKADATSKNLPKPDTPPDRTGDGKQPDAPTQTTDTPPPSKTGDTKDEPPPTRNTDNTTPGKDTPGVRKLPDALTVLDLVRRLPKWPPHRHFDDEADEDPETPQVITPQRGGDQDAPARKPQRVVNVPPNVTFKPAANAPRPVAAPPVIIGASGPEALDREVLVTLAPASTDATVFALAQDFGLDGQTLYVSQLLGARVVRFRIPDTRTPAEVVQQLAGDARVSIAAPHYVYTASQGAAKALAIPQYAPKKLKLDEAHKIAQGRRVKLAVIDTAVDIKHPVFAGARIETFDALGGVGSAETHGTAIAGIAAARAELESVAPAADLLSVRAFTAEKGGSAKSFTLAILKGLDFAVMSGARVVNMSFAGPDDPTLAKAVAAAEARGMILIAAAGNGGPAAKPAYPAAYKEVVAVTATDDSDALYKDANRGGYITVAAPGVDIIAAAPGGAYDISSGTSLAAAHVSGIAALMLEKNPKLTTEALRAALKSSARKPEGIKPEDMGAGIADAFAALDAVK